MFTKNVLKKILILLVISTHWCIAGDRDFREENPTDSTLVTKQKEVLNFFVYGEDVLKKYGAKAAVDSLLQFEGVYANSQDFGRKSFYYQVLMTFYAFFDYKKSLEYEYLAFNKQSGGTHDFTSQTTAVDAKQYLTETFGNERIILFNEAHNCSQHRAFMRDLLHGFRAKGFKYLAVEALSYSDSLLNKRKYPTQSSGLYINDPVFGQLIREALILGMKVVPYEDTTAYNFSSYIEGANVREENQAKSIFKLLTDDPTAKILVYAGHDHIHKTTTDGISRMAERLVKMTGFNIPAIDCTLMREGFSEEQENPDFIEALKRFPDAQKPFIVIDSGNVFVAPRLKKVVDAHVFFPRTTQPFGYPNWAFKSTEEPSSFCVPNQTDTSFFIVYDKTEFEQINTKAIPVFQAVQKKGERFCLPLEKEKYVVIPE